MGSWQEKCCDLGEDFDNPVECPDKAQWCVELDYADHIHVCPKHLFKWKALAQDGWGHHYPIVNL